MTCVTKGVHGLAGVDLTEAEQLDCDADADAESFNKIFSCSRCRTQAEFSPVLVFGFGPDSHNERWMMESIDKDSME